MSKTPIIKIRQIRELKGFSQEHMANLLKMSQRSYSKLERNETRLDWKKLLAIAKIFEMDPVELIRFDENQLFGNGPEQEGDLARLIAQYEARIRWLEEEVRFLRAQLDKS